MSADAKNPISDLFRKMADDIDRNAAAGFGGAFVCVPPTNGGDSFQTLIVGEAIDPSDFWNLLATKSKAQMSAVDAAQRTGQAFRR